MAQSEITIAANLEECDRLSEIFHNTQIFWENVLWTGESNVVNRHVV